MDGFVLGCRIRDVADGTRGTVKYIGPVAAAKNKSELWLGVEWDSTGRGKHDGSCLDEVAATSDERCVCLPLGCKEGFKLLIEVNVIGHLSFFLKS
jgi:CAP-Gly domain